MSRIVTFTNLFPSTVMPAHGVFVYQRMRRVAAALGTLWEVVAPVPHVAWMLRTGDYLRWAKVPPVETWQGVRVHHPRYRHWPMWIRRQAAAMAAGARDAVAALAAKERIVIDAHYLWPDGVAAAQLAQELGVPFTLTARGTDLILIARDPVIAGHIAEASSRAFACQAVSADLGDRFAAVAGLPRARVVDVRNGVDLELFRPGDPAAARAALGLPPAGRIVLGVGRLVERKGFHLAAAALASLPRDVSLVLVGEGSQRGQLEAIAPARVRCLGALPPEGVALACQAADVLVLPSSREGWPNVITEALASGLPVVATRLGGNPQILGDPVPRELGAWIERRDAGAVAAALRQVLETPPDRAAVRAFAQRYGWDEPVAALADTFRRALGDSRP